MGLEFCCFERLFLGFVGLSIKAFSCPSIIWIADCEI
ncbi:unnamed protein product [Brassica oleracea]